MLDNRTEDTCDLGGWCGWYEDLRWGWLEGVEAAVPPGVCKPEVAEVACIRCEIIWLCRATSGVLVWDCLCCCVCVWLGLFRNRTSSEILWIVILLITKHIFFSFRLNKQIMFYERVDYLIICPKIGSVLNFAQPASWIFKVPNSLESNQKQFPSSESKGLTCLSKLKIYQ